MICFHIDKRLVYARKLARRGFLLYILFMQKQIILFIDGENFLHKIGDVIRQEKLDPYTIDVSHIDLNYLLDRTLDGIKLDEKIFYAARLHEYADTKEKSKELIRIQRSLKTHLEKQDFNFILAGNVRAQSVSTGHKSTMIFKEKGVDVRIAVDMVSLACDNMLNTAVLCSSDSDLQPAVSELKKRGIRIIYLGFEMNPNKGLIYTTDRAILFRNSEIIDALKPVDNDKDKGSKHVS